MQDVFDALRSAQASAEVAKKTETIESAPETRAVTSSEKSNQSRLISAERLRRLPTVSYVAQDLRSRDCTYIRHVNCGQIYLLTGEHCEAGLDERFRHCEAGLGLCLF